MTGENTNRMGCAEFEGLLAEAVEGRLAPAQDAEFRGHAQLCPTCGPMLADALAGFEMLHALPDIEPPQHLVHNILISTSGVHAARGQRLPISERVRQWLLPVFTPMLRPRVAGSLAMAFFSVTLLLSLAGFRLSDLRRVDLRPSAIRQGVTRGYYQTSAKVVKYYDSMRVVYEFQTWAQEWKGKLNVQQPEQQEPSQQKKEPNDKDITRKPRPTPEGDSYSQRDSSMRLASSDRHSAGSNSTRHRRDA